MRVAPALVREGLIPSSPNTPSIAFTIKSLQLYYVTKMRTPQISTQSYIKSLCDLHGVTFNSSLPRHFATAYDIYIQVKNKVAQLVRQALRRDAPDWRLANVCPCCTYRLDDEPELKYSMFYTMDGNDSLKRVFKRSQDISDPSGTSSELPSSLAVPPDRYLDREAVDKWANGALDNLISDEVSFSSDIVFEPSFILRLQGMEDNPCAGRWKNMKDDITKKMWSIFDETGIFLAVCRHGFSLLIADMVRSGELAKYPLAVVEKLMKTFGSKLGGGFDIGCKFKSTLAKSRLGPLAREFAHTCLVGAFHGHAHRRLCQLDHLTTYVSGVGLEDFETCERKFSRSNSLAAPIRHASVFHRQQSIDLFFEYTDEFDVYPNLSLFLLNNYKQALEILDDGVPRLAASMSHLKISDANVFSSWLDEERTYLKGLEKEPIEETLQMTYWQRLTNLQHAKEDLAALPQFTFSITTPETAGSKAPNAKGANSAQALHVRRRHAQEKVDREFEAVHELEVQLGVVERWQPGSPEWMEAGRLVAMRSYQRALDKLEGLIVARIFEMSGLDRPGRGTKALKTRSAAIHSALKQYNQAAQALVPPRRTLDWDQVVEYAFLADFDLLRDARQDITTRDWAKPGARSAMDLHFKICRAREEIERVNVEVKRLATYLRDEDRYLHECEQKLRQTHPALAHQVAAYRSIRGRCNDLHWRRLHDISKLRGFSGSIEPGKGAGKGVDDEESDSDDADNEESDADSVLEEDSTWTLLHRFLSLDDTPVK
ncbi:hypothetical protein CONPUDRAFT_90395 [Coniophora puteana RWD-64-598 SS2]|uniref:CxC1-like cysteine cluster associated with KDZ transposases domain-containing protein n=1 Tax=Coniophora puteana (strain RWD-64-598) TaxID=741705 RepID=A0A5M3MR27_CONPW|nr:uncharacterized protein CONPUDRAFT_90395 [Coniophora puteana RWD-64-598 SS2]EIW81516.1 hypothetical protein CONPUDRAFT_90395 [Coniophora puteana RWD-64-598 SS2]